MAKAKEKDSKESPWQLKTAPGVSEYTIYKKMTLLYADEREISS